MPDSAVVVIVVAVLAAGLTFGIVRLLDRLTRRDAETEAKRIIDDAHRAADNRKKESELEIKELAIQQKAASEKEHSKSARNCTNASARSINARTPSRSKSEQLRKQEKMVETTQRKLAERIEDTNRRNDEPAKTARSAAPDAASAQRPEPRRGHPAPAGNAR